ncbi:hypothetical protein ALP8811_03040 [Aliiroseovarius pelagivivens]|uniref:GSCFA domain-containing protein n=1 Tax=Aliiroseovarius pelagivivens TaxID=1639690 RepID=A0A2R8ASV1_9RHOB|nr:GSCFA domain-containing protein [Aliiroseovarius pelagivivens]SPF79105.1 hypothetical protein ALP8811_03040 [Aliiroseovarius pelagivivens]
MPHEVLTPAEARGSASKNRLRQYPGAKRGRERLLPFAQPQIKTALAFPEGAKFFVAGNCFGRNVEKALAKAGRSYLSSPRDLDLPGSATQQYNRYNIFNLDVSTNEVAWAVDPSAPSPDDALIQVGDEWVDLQIHLTFAHELETARAYRKEYNTSYSGIADADVVILSNSGIEQWYDAKTGLYLNGMPSAKMTAQEPNRYEFHRLDVEACEMSFRRAIEIVLANTRVSPIILLAVSPVARPFVYGQNDALIENYLAKSCQNVAAQNVCRDYAQVEYLPSLEFAMLSDFKFAYQTTSPNHSTQGHANRVVAEMLLRYEGESPGYHTLNAIGQVEALISAEEYDQAVNVAEDALESGALRSVDFDFHYSQALMRAKQRTRAADWLVGRLDEAHGNDKDKVFRLATNIVRSYGTQEQIDTLIAYAKTNGVEEGAIEQLQNAMASRPKTVAQSIDASAVASIVTLFRARDFESTATEIEKVFKRPDVTEATINRLLPLLIQSYMNTNRHQSAMEQLLDEIERNETPMPRWITLLVRLAASRADIAIIDRILSNRDKMDDVVDLSALERRRASLNGKAPDSVLEA